MDRIKFANGAVHSCSYLSTIPNQRMAFIALDDVTFGEAAEIFSNPSMTEEMEWNNYILHGYTELLYVMKESYGYKACLQGGYDERIN